MSVIADDCRGRLGWNSFMHQQFLLLRGGRKRGEQGLFVLFSLRETRLKEEKGNCHLVLIDSFLCMALGGIYSESPTNESPVVRLIDLRGLKFRVGGSYLISGSL